MGSRSPHGKGAILREGKGCPIVKYRDTLRSPVKKTAEPIEIPFGLWAWMSRRNHVLDGGPAVPRNVAMTTNFGTKIAINWLCVNDTDNAIGYGRDFEWSADRMQILPISCTPGTLPWQPFYGFLYMGCTLALPREYD